MLNAVKKAIAVSAIAIGIGVFGIMGSVFAVENGDVEGQGMHSADSNVKGNAEAKGTANFTMSFSGSGRTKGDFKGNGKTNTNANLFGKSEDYGYRPYYYPTQEVK